jgi:phosphate transport system permease protein
MGSVILAGILIFAGAGFWLGRNKALELAADAAGRLHSRPVYHGAWAALCCGLPALLLWGLWLAFEDGVIVRLVVAGLPAGMKNLAPGELGLVLNDIRNLVAVCGNAGKAFAPAVTAAAARWRELLATSHQLLAGLTLAFSGGGLFCGLRSLRPAFRARDRVEKIVRLFLLLAATLAILTTAGIIFSVLLEALHFFAKIPVSDFLFGLKWSPQTAIRSDQVGSSGAFGMIPVFAGTLLISIIAMLVAVPLGLMSAIYLSEYARPRVRTVVKPLLEILAGIPTVVYGFFAALTVAPLIRALGEKIGLAVAPESALAAGLVMGVMIFPFISSLSDDVLSAVPQSLRDGSLGLGATRSETIRRVVIPAALPGIVSGILLAVSRAIGETMIVVMAAGLAANLTANPLQSVTTVTVQIVTLLVGDQEFDSAKTLAAFALGLVLFTVTLALNIVALQVVKRYREQYE